MNKLPPKKPNEEPTSQAMPRRQRLPAESACPSLGKVRVLLDEAQAKRGCLIEMPWTGGDRKTFILTVQWDESLKDPVWTLYEEVDGSSKVVWTQPFAAQDLEFMYDILSMSAGSTSGGGLSIPDELKPKPEAAEEETKPEFKKDEPALFTSSQHVPTLPPQQAQAPAMPGMPMQQPPMPQQPMPQQPMPQQPMPGYPQYPPYNAPGGSYQNLPSAYPPQYPYQQQQMPPNMMPPGYPPQPYPQQMPYPPQQMPQQMPQYQQPPSAPQFQQSSPEPKIPLDYHLIDKRANILIGSLLQEAGLISEPTLEAALKLQELVRDEKMLPEKAPDVLKRLHAMGGSIDQYLTKGDLEKTPGNSLSQPRATAPKPTPPPAPAQGQGQAQAQSQGQGRDLKGAFDLLQKAQLLTENDVTTAVNVRKKHGGDLVQILEAAGKVHKNTVDAALVSLPLIREGLMKIEQVIMALNYCERMRVGFDEALDEMGWPNPRKLRTDLPL